MSSVEWPKKTGTSFYFRIMILRVVNRMTHSDYQDQEILTLPHYHNALLKPIEPMWAFCKNYMKVAVNNTRQTISMI